MQHEVNVGTRSCARFVVANVALNEGIAELVMKRAHIRHASI